MPGDGAVPHKRGRGAGGGRARGAPGGAGAQVPGTAGADTGGAACRAAGAPRREAEWAVPNRQGRSGARALWHLQGPPPPQP
eukprot:85505-Rhodomonas_salina.1